MIFEPRFALKPAKRWIKLTAWAAVFCLTAIGCGGGGGGGGGGSSPSLIYSGLTTPAAITDKNAVSLSAGALDAGSSGTALTGVTAMQSPTQDTDQPGVLFPADLSKVVWGAIGKIDFQSEPDQNLSEAVQSEKRTIKGACGGSFTYDIQVDTVSGAFSGTLIFNGYCEDGLIIKGNTSFSGSINPSTKKIEYFTLSYDYVTAINGSNSVTMDGTITLSESGTSVTVTMDMVIRDDNINRTYKIEDYQMVTSGMGTYEQIDVSGRFYDPDYGYVDLQTSAPLLVNYSDQYPYSGQLVLYGATGAAGGPTSARLTAIDAFHCRVEADTDGDGQYDNYDSGPILWSEL